MEAFDKKLDLWSHAIGGPALHPLDDLTAEERAFVDTNVSDRSFKPWEEFRRPMGKTENGQLLDSCATSYYHHWQVFLAIEIEGMVPHCFFNQLDEDLMKVAWREGLGKIPRERMRVMFYRSVPDVRAVGKWAPIFEAVAYYLAYSNRAFLHATRDQAGPEVVVEGEALAALRERERDIANEAAQRWLVGPDQVVEFLKWQIERWYWWTDQDRGRYAQEYQQHIRSTLTFLLTLTGWCFEDVAERVGSIRSFKPDLKVVIPDWVADQTERAVNGLKRIVIPYLDSLSITNYQLTEDECSTLIDWLISEDFVKFLWHFDRLSDLRSLWDRIDRAALDSELECLGLTVEHAVNHLMAAQGVVYRTKGLLQKLRWLWQNAYSVAGPLSDHRQLASKGVQVGFAEIDGLGLAGESGRIACVLLKAATIRNHGTHQSLRDLSVDEIGEAHRILLSAIGLVWKRARSIGLLT